MKVVKGTAGFAVVALVLVLISGNAYGYIDPGTGSYLLQLLIAGVMGSLFVIGMFWRKVKAFFLSRFTKENPQEEEDE